MSVIINDSALAEVWKAIEAEVRRSEALHPNYPADTLRRTAITVEEALEALTEMAKRVQVLQQVALGVTRISAKDTYSMDHLKIELIQTAAMCVKHLRAINAEEERA